MTQRGTVRFLELDDAQIARLITMEQAVAVMRRALEDLRDGKLVPVSRHHVALDRQSLVVTPGYAATDGRDICGARVYLGDERSPESANELTFVFYPDDGGLQGVIAGKSMARWRTGALGGVAVDLCAPAEVRTIGVIGSGRQARTQLAAALAVRTPAAIEIYSPNADHRAKMVGEFRTRSGAAVSAAGSAREVVERADVLITATDCTTPVLRGEWLRDGVHVNFIGPKRTGRSEWTPDLLQHADALLTDSPEQARALGADFFAAGPLAQNRLSGLADLIGRGLPRNPATRSVFFSLGLAGTEVCLAHELLRISAAS